MATFRYKCRHCGKAIHRDDNQTWASNSDDREMTVVNPVNWEICPQNGEFINAPHEPGIVVVTNYHLRDVIRGHELSDKERSELDYYVWPDPRDWAEADYPDRWGENGPIPLSEQGPGNWGTQVGWDKEYVRYRDRVIDLTDMEGIPRFLPGWDQYATDSFFSGIAVRYARPCNCRYPVYHGDNCPNGEELDTEHVMVATYYAP